MNEKGEWLFSRKLHKLWLETLFVLQAAKCHGKLVSRSRKYNISINGGGEKENRSWLLYISAELSTILSLLKKTMLTLETLVIKKEIKSKENQISRRPQLMQQIAH